MGLFDHRRGEKRAFLDSSFERHGESYLFYRHHFARGIPVSAAEREAYLRPPLGGSRRGFHAAIEGRPATGPRRPWLRSQRATLAAIPPASASAWCCSGRCCCGAAAASTRPACARCCG